MRKEIVGSTGSYEVVGLEGRMGRVAGSGEGTKVSRGVRGVGDRERMGVSETRLK